ncbi:MAG: TrbG/VirB9 family P-type conjugative transfer protein [Alphaproteobacteria bacterium]|nr:TrbG/VirB9 family P-type conjugative transfer protein [Alphaproteobacteria bacterium]
MLSNKLFTTLLFIFLCLPFTAMGGIGKPIATDSRIKTLVYSANEVYHVTVQYGYQTNIEFGVGEDIQTISMGNSFILDATPVGRRLFLKPLEDNSKTNLTVITTKRSYYFEIQTKSETDVEDEELAYVIRFYYPDKETEFDESDNPEMAGVAGAIGKDSLGSLQAPRISSFNFDYALKGPERASPVRVFDDGQSTYLQFENESIAPSFSIIDNNKEIPISFRRLGPYYVISQTFPHLIMRSGYDLICIYNERQFSAQAAPMGQSMPTPQSQPPL